MDWPVYERRVEAIIFAAGEPIELSKIAETLEIEEALVKHCVERVRERYARDKSPFDIALLEGAAQMCTLPEYGECIRQALTLRRSAPLSQAALEVLAIIAYNQPVTRAFVEQVRGVDCSSIVRSLVEKALVEEAGRLQIPGKPISYRTTGVFLRSFGLTGLEGLPDLPSQPPEEEPDNPEAAQVEGQIDFFEMD